MSLTPTDREALETYEHQIRMARIFLFYAKTTVHRDWAFTMLQWSGERRRKAMQIMASGKRQKELF